MIGAAATALVAVVVCAACNGTAERTTPTAGGGSGQLRASLDAPGPPPPRDCSLLAPAIDRITATEIAEIETTRPKNVVPIAVAEVNATATALKAVLPALCEKDAWSGAYPACVAAAQVRDDARACQIHLTAEQQTHLEAGMAGHPAPDSLGIPECDAWQAIVVKVQTCDKFPAESREAIRQAMQQSLDTWRQSAMTPEFRAQIASACKQVVESMQQSFAAVGCPL